MDVFVGFFYDEDMEQVLLATSKIGISAAANQYQKGFLRGLTHGVHILTTIPTGAFPCCNRQLFFKKQKKKYGDNEVLYLPFINVHFIKNWMFKHGLHQALSSIIKAQEHTVIYVYSLNVVFEKVMAILKKQYGDKIDYCLIIPDLPGNYGIVRRGIKGVKDRMEAKPKLTLARMADRYVFLTEHMKELFPQKPYTVIEGFLPVETFDYRQERVAKTVLYTGTLGSEFGLQILLDAFSMIDDPECQLWICGAGPMEQQIRKVAENDSRIQFKGFLPRSEIAKLQTQCDVLVNPRTAEGEYTKYSFPSKTMEYLLSGSKVVMFRLPGIAEEYYQYIRIVEQYDAKAMANVLRDAWDDVDFYLHRSQKQVNWIKKEKDAITMVKKCMALYDEDHGQ